MILGIAGWSGSGKTSLIKILIPILNKKGIKVSTIKHADSSFDVDSQEKDSFIHRKAGATEVLISSQKRFALMHEYNNSAELELNKLLEKMSPTDLILVEGWKKENIKKIEVYRESLNKPLLATKDKNVIAIATDVKKIKNIDILILPLNKPEKIADYILKLLKY